MANVPDCPSVFVTTTFHCPVAAPVIGHVPLLNIAEPLKVNPEHAMSGCPVLVSFTVAPLKKLVPVTEEMATEALLYPDAGLIAVTVGAGAARVVPHTGAYELALFAASYATTP